MEARHGGGAGHGTEDLEETWSEDEDRENELCCDCDGKKRFVQLNIEL